MVTWWRLPPPTRTETTPLPMSPLDCTVLCRPTFRDIWTFLMWTARTTTPLPSFWRPVRRPPRRTLSMSPPGSSAESSSKTLTRTVLVMFPFAVSRSNSLMRMATSLRLPLPTTMEPTSSPISPRVCTPLWNGTPLDTLMSRTLTAETPTSLPCTSTRTTSPTRTLSTSCRSKCVGRSLERSQQQA